MKTKKVKYFKVAYGGRYFITSLEEVAGQLDSVDDETDIYELSVIYMTEEEYKNLPEFEGF